MAAARKAWGVLVLSVALSAAGLLLLLSVSAPPASADMFTFDLLTPNSALSGFTGPFAHVTVNQMSSTATITFDSLTNGGFIYLLGDSHAADLNVNASSFTVGSITGTNSLSGFTPGPFANAGAANVDGFGVFNLTTSDFDGFTHTATEITIPLTDTGGAWSSASNVLTPNADGQIAAFHAFACATSPATPCTGSLGATATGYVSVVPEPASLPLLGSGLLSLCGCGIIRWRRKPEAC